VREREREYIYERHDYSQRGGEEEEEEEEKEKRGLRIRIACLRVGWVGPLRLRRLRPGCLMLVNPLNFARDPSLHGFQPGGHITY
jgi:hypothetical protein